MKHILLNLERTVATKIHESISCLNFYFVGVSSILAYRKEDNKDT
jgi:hypothetical protein